MSFVNQPDRAVRHSVSRMMARHLAAHLHEELVKPDDVSDFVTAEGLPFRRATQELLDGLHRLFPDLADPPLSGKHVFRDWWDRFRTEMTDEARNSTRPYDQATFNTINQAVFFKILHLKAPSQERTDRFEAGMKRRIELMVAKGRSLEYESVLKSEILLFVFFANAAREEGLPPESTEVLVQSLDSAMGTVYRVLGHMLRSSLETTDQILKNVLPVRIVDELKKSGKVEPRKIESATVMFCDIVGFTQIAEKLPPEELIRELDLCFRHFERAMGQNHLEKIKTIGDSFMCAGGLSEPDRLHAVDGVLCALRIQEFMRKHIKSRSRRSLPAWHLRVGLHTGPVVAGVLGQERFNYDIWGDTVNTANRIEAAGEADRINISRATADLVRDFFSVESRGKIQVKGKGELEMFFVTGVLPPVSVHGRGRVPAREFWKRYAELRRAQAGAEAHASPR